MRRLNLILLSLLLSCGVALASSGSLSTSAAPVVIKRVIVFGDSLSDDGNDYFTTRPLQKALLAIAPIHSVFPTGLIPSAYNEPYFSGRFTNGKTWIEVLANQFGIHDTERHRSGRFIDFAYGGAWAHTTSLSNAFFPVPLYWQVESYSLRQLSYDNKANILAVILIGANDYLENKDVTVNQKEVSAVVAAQVNAIEKLYRSGIRHFLVAGLPRIDETPIIRQRAAIQGAAYLAKEKALVLDSNSLLAQQLQSLQQAGRYPGIDITYIDLAHIHDVLTQNLRDYGYDPSLAKQACYPMYPSPPVASQYIKFNGVLAKVVHPSHASSSFNAMNYSVYNAGHCADGSQPAQHIYFDQVHPTAKVHCMMALLACQQLANTGYQGFDFNSSGEAVAQPLVCHVSGSVSQQLQQAANYCSSIVGNEL